MADRQLYCILTILKLYLGGGGGGGGGVQCCFKHVELFTPFKSWILMLNMAKEKKKRFGPITEYFCAKYTLQVKSSFIVILLHVGTYSGTKRRASQDHGATKMQT